MAKYHKPLTPKQIAEIKDEDIDFSDIPELDESFWIEAELVEPDLTEQITLRVKRSVLKYFKSAGKGYQTRINQVLKSYFGRSAARNKQLLTGSTDLLFSPEPDHRRLGSGTKFPRLHRGHLPRRMQKHQQFAKLVDRVH